ncbi:MAG TPA: TIGR03619 family F420-dependent LLM class oxidoreductase, partial [Acidimicrobiales bacterium]|nr:TIGR03619 family F420-dependent LLM class oxidoreductase [Acidimicrobiales bacterium]
AGPAELAQVARACDEAGFDNISVCDHVAVPRQLADRMNTTWYDQVATLGWLAGITTRVRLLSQVYVLPYRRPLQAAKSFATLDALSGGRVIAGVGAGHVEGEFEALGVHFHDRGRLTDEGIAELRRLFGDEWGGGIGEPGDLGQRPRPVQPGGPPIWVGGSTAPARRRAARLGDGWIPQGPPDIGMEAAVAEIASLRKQAGLEGSDFAMGDMVVYYVGQPDWDTGRYCVTGSPQELADHLVSRAAIGVTHVQVRFRSRNVTELVDQIATFSAGVMPRVEAT